MIEVVPHRVGLPRFDERLGRAAVQGRDRLGAIPGHGLGIAAGPVPHAADDFEHFGDAGLGFGGGAAGRFGDAGLAEADGLGELGFGHAEGVGDTIHVDEAITAEERVEEGDAPLCRGRAGDGVWRPGAGFGYAFRFDRERPGHVSQSVRIRDNVRDEATAFKYWFVWVVV